MRNLAIAAFLLVALALAAFLFTKDREISASVYDRVMQSKTLRCSYMQVEPVLTRDIVSGKMSGMAVEYVETIAAQNGLTVKWAEEVPVDQLPAHLNAGRSDMFCLPASPTSDLDKAMTFAGYFGGLPYYVYVPYRSTVDVGNLSAARFTVVDGYIPADITPQLFPQAEIASLPVTASMGQLYDELRYGKTDAVVSEHVTALNYMQHNPETIRRLSDQPVKIMPMTFIIKKNDTAWANHINDVFGDAPQNRKLLLDLAAKHGMAEDALFTKEMYDE